MTKEAWNTFCPIINSKCKYEQCRFFRQFSGPLPISCGYCQIYQAICNVEKIIKAIDKLTDALEPIEAKEARSIMKQWEKDKPDEKKIRTLIDKSEG